MQAKSDNNSFVDKQFVDKQDKNGAEVDLEQISSCAIGQTSGIVTFVHSISWLLR